ncbi:aminotransferase class I/II-fold pyridoxal phosphate-dependent enzyme [Bacillus massiliigorillae]|uniref:aminotransferase class I/II-fold pyridoxal phosphate-dependent enzyme n=1 Tax=Bacillus massiliigorillae TaxID=1243664 RepID=UPI0003A67769|nr:aminotransferase class V-fold PLP-dependent enzyme [Bacillus massiliigorillae]
MKHIHKQTPLYDALEAYRNENPISCHVPGHKNGTVFQEKGKLIFQQLLQIDATEVEGLDDLHAPEGAILEAQQLLAQLYNAQKSYFLVNGSTCGNLAMILGNCREGDIVLVQRNCHKSVLHALTLAKATPIFLRTNINEEWGTAEGISVSTVQKALQAYPKTKAIILTYPSYYGIGDNIEAIISLAHKNHVTVLVDEAHGAHFIGREPFLKSSLAYGADYVVQSAHKTLPAMTMGSYLHVNHAVNNYRHVEMYLQMLQSSSPSYPIMASLDLARSYLGTLTDEDLLYTKTTIEEFKRELNEISGIRVLQHKKNSYDILKVTVQIDDAYTGHQLQSALQRYGIYSELADMKNVLLVLPILKVGQTFSYDRIVSGMKDAVSLLKKINKEKQVRPTMLDEVEELTELELSFEEMLNRETKSVPFFQAIDCIIAETIVPYPPGIPYMMKGEKITKKKIANLEQMIQSGTKFHSSSCLDERNIIVYV